jgi:hypothetical protein
MGGSLRVANQVAAAPFGVCAGGLDRLNNLFQCDVSGEDCIMRANMALVAEPGPAGEAWYVAVLALEIHRTSCGHLRAIRILLPKNKKNSQSFKRPVHMPAFSKKRT